MHDFFRKNALVVYHLFVTTAPKRRLGLLKKAGVW